MKYILLILVLNIFAFANTTMCYKNNIIDISDIENKKFDGGECKSKYTINDMKEKNWNIDDIKISQKDNTFSFIYILKRDVNKIVKSLDINNSKIDYTKLNENLNKEKENKEFTKSLIDGKRVYNKLCKSCHGINGEETPYNTSEKLNTMSLDHLKTSIRDYSMDEKDNGFAIVMKPYADSINSNEIENIYKYLQSINIK